MIAGTRLSTPAATLSFGDRPHRLTAMAGFSLRDRFDSPPSNGSEKTGRNLGTGLNLFCATHASILASALSRQSRTAIRPGRVFCYLQRPCRMSRPVALQRGVGWRLSDPRIFGAGLPRPLSCYTLVRWSPLPSAHHGCHRSPTAFFSLGRHSEP